MKRTPFTTMAAACLGLFGASCASPGTRGEILLAIHSDMSVPKDVDKLGVEVLSAGVVRLQQEYSVGPNAEKIPATLGILANLSNAAIPATIRVAARQNGRVRLLREVVTTAPEGRVALLRIPIQWLCTDDFATEAAQGNFGDTKITSTCGTGQTCIAGSCLSSTVDSSKLPDYRARDVYGGGDKASDGTCFDTTTCFTGAIDVPVDLKACTIPAQQGGMGVNVAIRTDVAGICGPEGCFVALDGDGEGAWKEAGGTITLPTGVCDRLTAGKALGVVASTRCATKTESVPTCGAWSSVGGAAPPSTTLPVVLAAGQNHPAALALDDKGANVYWAAAGTFGKKDGSVRKLSLDGGSIEVVAANEDRPRGVAVIGGVVYWTSAGTGTGTGAVKTFSAASGTPVVTVLAPGQQDPEGIAVDTASVYWTTSGDNQVSSMPRAGGALSSIVHIATKQNHPVQFVLGPKATPYWTNEGTSGALDGSVVSPAGDIAQKQDTPVGIAADDGAVYWATFSMSGTINRYTVSDGKVTVLAKGQASPSAVAVDATTVYWANRADGTIMSMPKAGGTPQLIAAGQQAPVAIAVDGTNIYWVTDGTSGRADGTVMKRAK